MTQPRYHWRIDKRLGSDVQSRDCVCWPSVAARNAEKVIPCFTVFLSYMPTTGAFLGCVLWVDKNNWNTQHLRFVSNKRTKLVETPVRQPFALVLSGRYPVTNTTQILKVNK